MNRLKKYMGHIGIRATKKEKREWHRIARKEFVTLSDWIRNLCRKEVKRQNSKKSTLFD